MRNILLAGGLALATGLALGQDDTSTPGFSGKVVETTNTAGYTYVRVDTGADKRWAAAPQFEVKPGDSVVIAAGMPMRNYHSKTLNRDFDVVYFCTGIAVNGVQPAAGRAPAVLPKDHPPIAGATAPRKVDLSGIKRAAGGKTIQEIFAGKAKLTGQQVKVRGRVVKYNAMILGKNWLHVQDGTGGEGNNDLTVTTASEAKIGDTVLITGTVAANKDFGAGYKYALMIEDAKVTVE